MRGEKFSKNYPKIRQIVQQCIQEFISSKILKRTIVSNICQYIFETPIFSSMKQWN